MTPTDVEQRIEDFVRSHFGVAADDPRFDRSADLFEGGYVDSVGFAELLEFLHDEFGVEVPEDELLSDEFARIEGIAQVVSRLNGTG